jgi:hypothetical protein
MSTICNPLLLTTARLLPLIGENKAISAPGYFGKPSSLIKVSTEF